ncbi:MAG: DNA-binding protein [Candidatus Thorarchaeota archaeon]|nr:DNA-binding protein [Candidatus Thorarchaeota archaeon]
MEPGEDILETLESIVLKDNITAGHLMLIGAISGATLGYFDLETQEYKTFTVDEDLEVTSCIGNIASSQDGTPVVHAHLVVADEKGTSYSGHLMKGCKVSVTIEVIITVLEGDLKRAVDDKTGLNLLSLV